jgi:hypothetical protein
MVPAFRSLVPIPANPFTPPPPPHHLQNTFLLSAGILEQYMGLGTEKEPSCRTSPPAYVAWRAGTTTLFLLGSLPP